MASKYSVSLEKIINEFGFETIYLPCDASELSITSQEVSRPGLLLAGNDKYFDPARVQYLGFAEFEYVKSLDKEQQLECIERLFSKQPSVVIITRSLISILRMSTIRCVPLFSKVRQGSGIMMR